MDKALREKLEGGEFRNVEEADSKRMRAVKGKGNRTTELLFRLTLVRAGIKGWTLHPKGIPGKPDFYFPTEEVAVFTDGCYWHGCPRCGHVPKVNNAFWSAKLDRTRRRDVEKVAELEAIGVRCVRLWEHELKEDRRGCLARVRALLSEERRPTCPGDPRAKQADLD